MKVEIPNTDLMPPADISDVMRQHAIYGTYDHRSVKTGHPVRSAIHKH
jgi:hypothetical protein